MGCVHRPHAARDPRHAVRRVVLPPPPLALAFVAVAPGAIAGVVATWSAFVAGLGGLAWGAFGVHLARSAFPPLDGLERVPHGDLVRILKTWCLAAAERLVVLAIGYGGLLLLLLWLGDELAVSTIWTGLVIAPAGLWLAQLWIGAWVECIAARLDRRMVEGAPSAENPWSSEVADYLMGYVRRTGWDLDPALLRPVVFLPGKRVRGDIVVYGGGATHVRIVIDRELLVMAMGPLIEGKSDEKPVEWPDWTLAQVRPRRGARERGARGARAQAEAELPGHASASRSGSPRRCSATCHPAPGKLVPLISDNPQDLAIVRKLLSGALPVVRAGSRRGIRRDRIRPTRTCCSARSSTSSAWCGRNETQLATIAARARQGCRADRVADPRTASPMAMRRSTSRATI